jgi:hypothetical protein
MPDGVTTRQCAHTMSDRVVSPQPIDHATPARRGQTLVEFALTLPMLIVLLLGIGDFARVFQAGIVTEAAARNGAEAAAIERLRVKPPPSTDPTFVPYYAHLHDVAAQAACAETRDLPNTVYAPDNPSTPIADDDLCTGWPVIAVCVQDGQDPLCGQTAPGHSGPMPPGCGELSGMTLVAPDPVVSHHVEVGVCYRFTTLMNLDVDLPLGWGLTLGDVYLERVGDFVVDCPPPDLAAC